MDNEWTGAGTLFRGFAKSQRTPCESLFTSESLLSSMTQIYGHLSAKRDRLNPYSAEACQRSHQLASPDVGPHGAIVWTVSRRPYSLYLQVKYVRHSAPNIERYSQLPVQAGVSQAAPTPPEIFCAHIGSSYEGFLASLRLSVRTQP